MYHKPKVSVIIPCYNSEKHLQKAVDSVFKQSLESIEIILVDDGSTDKTPALLQQLKMEDLRVEVITHPKNMGLGAARNSGMEKAAGEYLFFLDSDDYIHPNTFEVLYEKAKEENLDILQARFILHQNDKQEVYPKDLIPFSQAISGTEYYNQGVFIEPKACGKLWKTNFVKENNLKFSTGYYEDMLMVFEAFVRARRVNNSLFPAYHYVRRNDSITGQKTSLKHIADYKNMLINLQSVFMQEKLIDKSSSFPASFLLYLVELCYMSHQLKDKEILKDSKTFVQKMIQKYKHIIRKNNNISTAKKQAMLWNPCLYAQAKTWKSKRL